MRFMLLGFMLCSLVRCTAATTTLTVGMPWKDVIPAAREHGYVIGDTSGFEITSTLFNEPAGTTLELANDSKLLVFPSADIQTVESMAIYENVSQPKSLREWKEITWFDLKNRWHGIGKFLPSDVLK